MKHIFFTYKEKSLVSEYNTQYRVINNIENDLTQKMSCYLENEMRFSEKKKLIEDSKKTIIRFMYDSPTFTQCVARYLSVLNEDSIPTDRKILSLKQIIFQKGLCADGYMVTVINQMRDLNYCNKKNNVVLLVNNRLRIYIQQYAIEFFREDQKGKVFWQKNNGQDIHLTTAAANFVAQDYHFDVINDPYANLPTEIKEAFKEFILRRVNALWFMLELFSIFEDSLLPIIQFLHKKNDNNKTKTFNLSDFDVNENDNMENILVLLNAFVTRIDANFEPILNIDKSIVQPLEVSDILHLVDDDEERYTLKYWKLFVIKRFAPLLSISEQLWEIAGNKKQKVRLKYDMLYYFDDQKKEYDIDLALLMQYPQIMSASLLQNERVHIIQYALLHAPNVELVLDFYHQFHAQCNSEVRTLLTNYLMTDHFLVCDLSYHHLMILKKYQLYPSLHRMISDSVLDCDSNFLNRITIKSSFPCQGKKIFAHILSFCLSQEYHRFCYFLDKNPIMLEKIVSVLSKETQINSKIENMTIYSVKGLPLFFQMIGQQMKLLRMDNLSIVLKNRLMENKMMPLWHSKLGITNAVFIPMFKQTLALPKHNNDMLNLLMALEGSSLQDEVLTYNYQGDRKSVV